MYDVLDHDKMSEVITHLRADFVEENTGHERRARHQGVLVHDGLLEVPIPVNISSARPYNTHRKGSHHPVQHFIIRCSIGWLSHVDANSPITNTRMA